MAPPCSTSQADETLEQALAGGWAIHPAAPWSAVDSPPIERGQLTSRIADPGTASHLSANGAGTGFDAPAAQASESTDNASHYSTRDPACSGDVAVSSCPGSCRCLASTRHRSELRRSPGVTWPGRDSCPFRQAVRDCKNPCPCRQALRDRKDPCPCRPTVRDRKNPFPCRPTVQHRTDFVTPCPKRGSAGGFGAGLASCGPQWTRNALNES